jgi:hypothetical protein
LRAGCASALSLSKKADLKEDSNAIDKLDTLSILLLEEFQRSESNKILLVDFEMKIWNIISEAKLIFQEEVKVIRSLLEGVIQAIGVEVLHSLFSQVMHVVRGMTSADLTAWLSSPLSSTVTFDSCLYPSIISMRSGKKNEIGNLSSILPFTAGLAQRYTDRICRLMLSRCILVAGMFSNDTSSIFGIEEVSSSLRTFLHTTSLVWLQTQIASTRNSKDTSKDGSKVPPPRLAFSPAKKSRISEASLRKVYNPPTILEYCIKDLFEKSEKIMTYETNIGDIVTIAKTYVKSIFQGDVPVPTFIQGLSNKPRLSLRLLAPFVSYPPPSVHHHETSARNGLVAGCLLSEADSLAMSNCLNEQNSKKLLNHASALLLKRTSSSLLSTDKNDLDIFFSAMRSLPDDWISSRSVTSDQYHDKRLVEILNQILEPYASSIHKDEILNLAKMETLRNILLPWIVASQQERTDPFELMIRGISKATSDPKKVMTKSILVLLHVSNLINRVTLIENHSTTATSSILKVAYADVLLSATRDIIQQIQNHFTPSICEYMCEYAALWSSAFRHAVNGRRWDEAFKACLSNPLKERRVKNFKRLVLAMVDAGALNKLINNILFTVVDWQSSLSEMDVDGENDNLIDLYELAADTLAQAASERVSSGISGFDILSQSNVNYRGCLYTLHAAHNEWRRCCQTMDLYGIISQGNLLMAEELTLTKEDHKELDRNVMDEIVLSSVASSQLIHLVPAKGHRYIVSGELDPYPIPPPFREMSKEEQFNQNTSISKRVREEDALPSSSTDHDMKSETPSDRISRLLTEQELASKATRSIALRTLYNDALSPESLVDIIQSSDRQLIEALSRLGYFPHVIAIANCKRDDRQGAKSGGRDVLADAISHTICEYILPNTMKLLQLTSREEWVDDEEEPDGIQDRPTLNQLRLCSGNGCLPLGCEVWRNDTRNNEVERGSIAMNLVQMYTMKYSGSSNSLASEVAQTLLDIDSGIAELPIWLHDFLLGRQNDNHGTNMNPSSGLFAERNGGDPAELVRLYMKKGLLSHACKVVHDVLMGKGDEREEQATSRLPEKGSIDFVPYGIIDQLWNTIEAYIQSPNSDLGMKTQLISDRSKMEKAIEKHFRLMQISEMGMLSTRALHPH